MDTDKFFNDNLFDSEVKVEPEPDTVVDKADADAAAVAEEVDSFDELGLKETLLRGLYGYGFEKPSKIQKRAVPMVLTGGDVIAQSQSGTGCNLLMNPFNPPKHSLLVPLTNCLVKPCL